MRLRSIERKYNVVRGESQINSTAGEVSVNKFYRDTVSADTLGQVDQTLSRARVPPRDQLNHKRTYGDQHSSSDRAVMYNSIGFQHCVGECRLHGTLLYNTMVSAGVLHPECWLRIIAHRLQYVVSRA